MAGDWIKFEHATLDKPEVLAMADTLEIEPEQVIGHLLRVWVWADSNVTVMSRSQRDKSVTETGHDRDICHAVVTPLSSIDRIARCKGFGAALQNVGWLEQKKDGLVFPNFARHNKKPAKNRALASARKRHARSVTETGQQRDNSVTREEKSIKKPLPLRSGGKESAPKGAPRAPENSSSGIRLPETAELGEVEIQAAKIVCPVADTEQIRLIWTAFVGHYSSLPDSDRMARAKAWMPRWRKWLAKDMRDWAQQQRRGQGNGGAGRQTAFEQTEAALDAIERFRAATGLDETSH